MTIIDPQFSYEDGFQDGMAEATDANAEIAQAVIRWLNNHIGTGKWYDDADGGPTADDVVQALFEAVKA